MGDEEDTSSDRYGGGDTSLLYISQPYFPTESVINMRRLPRFGYGSDFTDVFSSNEDSQAEYTMGLVALFAFLLIFFALWTISIIVFKIMGENSGFLSGRPFQIPDDPSVDEKSLKRPRRVRIAFLVATGFCMAFTFLFVIMGLTNVNNATITMAESLQTVGDLISNTKKIAHNLRIVGSNSLSIRDAAVAELDMICPQNPDIAETVGIDINGIADQARSDLTDLATFINEGLAVLDKNLETSETFSEDLDNGLQAVQFWSWEFKLLSAGLFILPSFFVIGVGFAMLDIDSKTYQNALTYFFMPVFAVAIIVCYVVCAAMLPISATAADACIGGGVHHGGPDDTILTVYRNIRGVVDDDNILLFLGYYTQQCDPKYYPFGFIASYLAQLDEAIRSTDEAGATIAGNLDLLQQQCGREFDTVIRLINDMNRNLVLLREQADLSLDLVKCRNINELYINTVHQAGCTYSVDALAWVFASSLVISVSGLIMIMLRSSYYPEEYVPSGCDWKEGQGPMMTESLDSADSTLNDHARPGSPLRRHPQAAPSLHVSQSNSDSKPSG